MFRLFCDNCGFNKYTDGSDIGLVEYKRNPVVTTSPYYDAEQKKTIEAKTRNLPRQYKCPGCGRLITLKNS